MIIFMLAMCTLHFLLRCNIPVVPVWIPQPGHP